MASQVNVDKIQHSKDPAVIGLEITNAGTNFYLNPVGAGTPAVNGDIQSSTGVGIAGKVLLGDSTAPMTATNRASFVASGTGFRFDGFTNTGSNSGRFLKEYSYRSNGAVSNIANYYFEYGSTQYYSGAPSGNYSFNISNAPGTGAGSNMSLNDRLQTGDAVMMQIVFPVNSSSGTLSSSGFSIDGVNLTSSIQWHGEDNPVAGTPDTAGPGGTSGYDSYTFYIEKTGNASWIILGSFGHQN